MQHVCAQVHVSIQKITALGVEKGCVYGVTVCSMRVCVCDGGACGMYVCDPAV